MKAIGPGSLDNRHTVVYFAVLSDSKTLDPIINMKIDLVHIKN